MDHGTGVMTGVRGLPPGLAGAPGLAGRQQPPLPCQAATVSVPVYLALAVLKPKVRLARLPQVLVSSAVFQVPRVNLYASAATGTPVMVSVQVPVPVWVIG